MELGKEFENVSFERETIIYPAYQTTHRFENLYSDVRTWVRELIQNADDADASTIEFKVNMPIGVEVSNNGNPFDTEDIKRMLTPCLGGKDFEKTGAMNLGALSVLSVSDTPTYHSGNTILKFVMNHEEEDFIPYINRHHEIAFAGTKLFLPFHPRLSSNDIKKLDKLDQYLRKYPYLLFASHLNEIKIIYPKKEHVFKKVVENTEIKKENRIKAEIRKISIIENIKKKFRTKENRTEWLVFKTLIQIPKKYATKGNENIENAQLPVYIAFFMENNIPSRVEYPIFIIFPSETPFGLGFLLSSNFIPETSRKGFATEGNDGKINTYLLRKVSELLDIAFSYFKTFISKLPEEQRTSYFYALIETFYYNAPYNPFEAYIKEYIYKKLKRILKENLLDDGGKWVTASEAAISDKELKIFFHDKYRFLTPLTNEQVIELLNFLRVRKITGKDLVHEIITRNINNEHELYNAWVYISEHYKDFEEKNIMDLLQNESLLSEAGKVTRPLELLLPTRESLGLYSREKVIHQDFIKNKKLRIFLQELGVKDLEDDEVLKHFILKKNSFSFKNIDLIRKYYEFFYNKGLYDLDHPIVLTKSGFKVAEEAFFNDIKIPKSLENYINFVPKELENHKNCRKYLEILGVSKKLTPNHIISLIKKKGASIIDLEVLKFLSENSHEISKNNLNSLKTIDLIPSINGKKVKAKDCYFYSEYHETLFQDSVFYFDMNAEENEIGKEFYEKLGIKKEPKIEHLRNALDNALVELSKVKTFEKVAVQEQLARVELIYHAIHQNKEKEKKSELIALLRKIKCIPSSIGLSYTDQVYIMNEEIQELLGDYMPFSLIKLPTVLAEKLSLREKPLPEDVANYLLTHVCKRKFKNNRKNLIKQHLKTLDTIFSFLGQSKNLSQLTTHTKKKLISEKIIYIPERNSHERSDILIASSKEAKILFGDNRTFLELSHYPNSATFFKKIGLKTSVTTDDLAEFLIEYCSQENVETKRLFMLYNNIGNRFRFLSDYQKKALKKCKIILKEDFKSFSFPHDVFIPDEKAYTEKFSSLNIAVVNNKILDFLEAVGVRKLSEVIQKKILFKGEKENSGYLKILKSKLMELIPYIETILKETNIILKNNWKNRFRRVQYITCEELYYEISYKNETSQIMGSSVEYDDKTNTIGIINEISKKEPDRFLNDLSRTIAALLFHGDISRAKIMSPLIEKLLESQNKIDTLNNLGFSTFKLEIKKFNVPDLQLKIRDIEASNNPLFTSRKSEKIKNIFENLPKISSKNENTSIYWQPSDYKVYKKEKITGVKIKRLNDLPNIRAYPKDQLKIIVDELPSKRELVKEIQSQLDNIFSINRGNVVDYYKLDKKLKKNLRKNERIIFKSMEFAARAEYGGLEINPPVPKLNLQKKGDFYYYDQGKNTQISIESLEKFKNTLEYIVKMMGGNPDTVSVAIFNTPVHAFNFKGQLIFNYSMMVDEKLEKEIPLFLIWIMVAAHELAHDMTKKHDQLHSKYMMIFTIEALKNLQLIIQKYKEIYC